MLPQPTVTPATVKPPTVTPATVTPPTVKPPTVKPPTVRQPAEPEAQERPGMFPEDTLRVRPLRDPLVEKLGHRLKSDYVEKYWLSVLGPSAVLLLRRFDSGLTVAENGYDIDMPSLSIQLGLGRKGGKNGPLWRSVERLVRFDVAKRNGEILAVRSALPSLPLRYLQRLPEALQEEHRRQTTAGPAVWLI